MDPLRILLIEDNPVDVDILHRYLKKLPDLPAVVVHASSGQDGLRIIRVAPPEVVFLDIHLPDMTGLDFLAHLQEVQDSPAVVVLTGSADETTAVEAMKAGALDYINKNRLNSSMLERTIKNALERHTLQAELTSTRIMLGTMIQEAGVGMALLDPQLHFLHVNDMLAQLSGLSQADMVGQFCCDVPSPLIQQLEWMCQRVLLSGRSYKDLEVKTGQGEDTRHWLCSVYPVRSARGQVQWVGITVTDITRSKQTALLLQHSQNQLNLTLEATRVGTWEWDSRTSRIQWMGHTDRILGFQKQQNQARLEDFLQHIHPEDSRDVRDTLKEALRAGGNFELEMRIIREDKSIRWVMSRGRVDRTLVHTLMYGTLIDITDLKEAELAFREISQVQQRFVNDAAHELRAPLTAIQGNLDLIHRYTNMREEDKEEALADVAREATRLSRLVQDMLALARGDAGGLVRQDSLDLADVVDEALQAVSFHLRPHKVTMSLQQAMVMGDHDRLKQVLVIVLENAAKYTPEGGQVEVTMHVQDQQVEVRVQDSGMGIHPEDLPRVFERFYRGQFSREKDPGGTGLGLPIAKWIVEAHDGALTLDSEYGAGTTLTLKFPLLDP